MKIAKYICDMCGYAERPTWKDYIANFLSRFIVSCLAFVFVMSGTYFVVIYFNVPILALNDFVGNVWTNEASEYSDELRLIAINLTDNCEDMDDWCKAFSIYRNLNYSKEHDNMFSINQAQNPIYTYKYGGDCEDLSILYVALARSIGVNSQVLCSVQHQHCIAKATVHGQNMYFDLAQDALIKATDDGSAWSEYERFW